MGQVGNLWSWLDGLRAAEPVWGVLAGFGVLGLLVVWFALGRMRGTREGGAGGEGRARSRSRVLGDLLLVAGLASLALAGAAYVSELTGGDRVLPRPVALVDASAASVVEEAIALPPLEETPTPLPRLFEVASTARSLATAEPSPTMSPTATEVPTATPAPTATPTPVKPGIPTRIVVASIGVDSEVREAGTYWANGQLYWQTLPFVVAHYRTTARAGEKGNAVFSGHVTSRNAGNVFRDLYKVELGDEVRIYTAESEFVYVVSSIRLVPPTEVSVMDPTPDATATLITCAGEWIPAEQNYSQRLIVAARLKR